MAYASWSVVFGEQPSATKWNILGTNDSSFNDGSGIADSKILPRHLLTGTGSTNWVWNNGTPAGAGFSSKVNDALRYIQVGKNTYCHVFVNGTSNATTFTFTLPVAAKAADITGGLKIANNGAVQTVLGAILFTASSTTATCLTNMTDTGTGWTASSSKLIQGYFFYEAL